MAETNSPHVIASCFVKQYYEKLTVAPDELFLFYKDDSQFFHCHSLNDAAVSIQGQDNIRLFIEGLNLRDVLVDLRAGSLDAQFTENNSLFILVTGALSFPSSPNVFHPFVQSFFLLREQNKPLQFFVKNSIFRLLDELVASPIPPSSVSSLAMTSTPSSSSSSPVQECEAVFDLSPVNEEPVLVPVEVNSFVENNNEDTAVLESGEVELQQNATEKPIEEPVPVQKSSRGNSGGNKSRNNGKSSNNNKKSSNITSHVGEGVESVETIGTSTSGSVSKVSYRDAVNVLVTESSKYQGTSILEPTSPGSGRKNLKKSNAVASAMASNASEEKDGKTEENVVALSSVGTEITGPSGSNKNIKKKKVSDATNNSTSQSGETSADSLDKEFVAAKKDKKKASSDKKRSDKMGAVTSSNQEGNSGVSSGISTTGSKAARSVFVYGVRNLSEKTLRTRFEIFGNVVKVDISDKNYAFVEFEEEGAAEAAVKKHYLEGAHEGDTLRIETRSLATTANNSNNQHSANNTSASPSTSTPVVDSKRKENFAGSKDRDHDSSKLKNNNNKQQVGKNKMSEEGKKNVVRESNSGNNNGNKTSKAAPLSRS